MITEEGLDDVAPLDQDDAVVVGQLLERQIGHLGRPLEPVQVGVMEHLGAVGPTRQVVAVHERERRRRDRFGDAERASRIPGRTRSCRRPSPRTARSDRRRAKPWPTRSATAWVSTSECTLSSNISALNHSGADARARASRHASADAADDLVADGSEPVGPVRRARIRSRPSGPSCSPMSTTSSPTATGSPSAPAPDPQSTIS